MSEGENAFRVQVVLPVSLGSSSLRKPEVDLIAAAATRMAKYPVEDPLAIQVLFNPNSCKSFRVREGWEIE